MVRVSAVGDMGQHVFKLQQGQGQLLFGRFSDGDVACHHMLLGGLAQHALHAGVSVLQIRCGIAFKRQHGRPVEDVVRGARFGQIGVFHRAYAHGVTNVSGSILGQIGVFRLHQSGGALF